MVERPIHLFLAERLGLAAEAVGRRTIDRAMADRMAHCGLSRPEAYLAHVTEDPGEWDALVERVVVPETWFFRNAPAFDFLNRFVMSEWLPANPFEPLRILSIPCATGEEAYSIAMSLLDAGMAENRFHIDAVDVSVSAIAAAEHGYYAPGAFRKEGLEFRDRFFQADGGRFRIDAAVRRQVRFLRGNILDRALLAEEAAYHIVFCRNLLIYLTPEAQRAVIRFIERRLCADGLLFLGHAEPEMLDHSGFAWRSFPYPFAYRRGGRKSSVEQERRPTSPETSRRKPPSVAPPAKPPSIPRAMPDPGPRATDPAEDRLASALRMADQGDLDQAFRLCESYLNQHPTHACGHYLMGMLYQAVGNTRQAEHHLDKAVYLDPSHLAAMEQLSLIAEHRGDAAKAARLRKRAGRIMNREIGA